MGSKCVCGSKRKSSDADDKSDQAKPPISGSRTLQPTDLSESTENIHSSEEILDDNFKADISKIVDEYIAAVPTKCQNEHDRLVNEMKRASPERYLGLAYSDYPDVNGRTVNEMARRFVVSTDVQQAVVNQVEERIESSFESRTDDWNESSREAAHSVVKTYIEKLVKDGFDNIKFE